MSRGKHFEIYLQAAASRVSDKADFLREAELLCSALDKKKKPSWGSIKLIFAAFLKDDRAFTTTCRTFRERWLLALVPPPPYSVLSSRG
jgi:hypothetical protein